MTDKRKDLILGYLKAQVLLFDTQKNLESAFDEIGIETIATKKEIHIYSGIKTIAEALGIEECVVPFGEDYPDTMEHYIIYEGYKFFELVDVEKKVEENV